jgi:hypothetical protein
VHVDFGTLGQRTGALILDLLSTAPVQGHSPRTIDVGLSIIERASVAGSRV